MLKRLPYDEKRDHRAELDRALLTSAWVTPWNPTGREAGAAATRGPAWWRGDEDASQSFLAAVGVNFGA